MKSSQIGIAVLCLFLISATHAIYSEWRLHTTHKGMQIFTRPNANSGIKEVRVKMTMKGTTDDLLDVFDHVPGYTKWVYKSYNAKLLKRVSKDEFYYYIAFDLPFPASDRDVVVHSMKWIDAKTGSIHTKSVSAPDYMPEKSGMVRIRDFQSTWKINPAGEGIMSIDYIAVTDPAGSIPAWIVNMGVTTGPIHTMTELEKCVSVL